MLGTITKSFVFVFKAESSGLSFLRLTNYKNFLGVITESIDYPTLIGRILYPF